MLYGTRVLVVSKIIIPHSVITNFSLFFSLRFERIITLTTAIIIAGTVYCMAECLFVPNTLIFGASKSPDNPASYMFLFLFSR